MSTTVNDSDFRSKISGVDMTSSQYMMVTLETDDTVILATAITDIIYGVVQNAPNTGELALIKVTGETKVVAAAVLVVDNFVGPSTAAKAQVAVSTQYARGKVVAAAGADLDVAVIQLFDTAVALA